MHRPHSITWTGDFREHTTLLEGTTRSSTLHCTTLHLDVQHCVMILHYNTTLTPSSEAIYSGTKYYDTHIEFHSLFLDVSSIDV